MQTKPNDEPLVTKRCQPSLGTYVEIAIVHPASMLHSEDVIDQAFAQIQRVNQLMSFHDCDSDLSRINQYAHQQVVEVHEWTYQVLLTAQSLYKDTNGSFDCSIAHHLQAWGLLPEMDQAIVHEQATLSDLELIAGNKVRFQRPMRIDLGGIAKGFAVDRAIDTLEGLGISKAWVNAGGDIRILGDQAESILIRDPQNPQILRELGHLMNGAIASSAPYMSKEMSKNQNNSALVNPSTGMSIKDPKSYSVIAPTCVIADGLTKALAVDLNLTAPYFEKYQAIPIVL